VDIDGTAAEMVDRGPYDEHLVYNDAVRELFLPQCELCKPMRAAR
jgi:hypothetical protein